MLCILQRTLRALMADPLADLLPERTSGGFGRHSAHHPLQIGGSLRNGRMRRRVDEMGAPLSSLCTLAPWQLAGLRERVPGSQRGGSKVVLKDFLATPIASIDRVPVPFNHWVGGAS